jgi:hypothetical protein
MGSLATIAVTVILGLAAAQPIHAADAEPVIDAALQFAVAFFNVPAGLHCETNHHAIAWRAPFPNSTICDKFLRTVVARMRKPERISFKPFCERLFRPHRPQWHDRVAYNYISVPGERAVIGCPAECPVPDALIHVGKL